MKAKMISHQPIKKAWHFVVLIGIVSLFADMTYEGARSITGQYLAILGASATVIGIVAGLGEFIGYTLRLVGGILADRTGQYWAFTLLGYTVNVFAVPLLAIAGRWETAVAFMFIERFGKALRTPTRDAMLSHTASQIGSGTVFGIHEALDQIGAILGPLLMALVLSWHGDYRISFLTLALPAFLSILALLTAWRLYPQPQRLEIPVTPLSTKLPRQFWWYLIFVSFTVSGFPHFQLLAYHFKVASSLSEALIPLAFGLAMATDAIAALMMGRWFDRIGSTLLISVPLLTFLSALALFIPHFVSVWFGMVLWGIVMGGQESVMRAVIAKIAPPKWRASTYGVFNTTYGLAWMLGSAFMGVLCDQRNITGLLIFIASVQFASIPFLLIVVRSERNDRRLFGKS